MNFLENEKQKIKFALDLLKEINMDGYSFNSLNKEGELILLKGNNDEKKINIFQIIPKHNDIDTLPKYSDTYDIPSQIEHDLSLKYSETSEIQKPLKGGMSVKYSETSDIQQLENNMSIKYSETSEISKHFVDKTLNYSETSEMLGIQNKMSGGSKNIFQKIKNSETSSVKMSNISNNSKTSSEIFNQRSDKYSETSVIGQIGGKNIETTDTLVNISELKQRKNSKSTNLDMGIFKKNQSGGSIDIKKKMMDVGINSNSSTSSICE